MNGDDQTLANTGARAADMAAPRAVRYAVLAAVAILLGGAILLATIRGPAILIDLASGVKTFFCL